MSSVSDEHLEQVVDQFEVACDLAVHVEDVPIGGSVLGGSVEREVLQVVDHHGVRADYVQLAVVDEHAVVGQQFDNPGCDRVEDIVL